MDAPGLRQALLEWVRIFMRRSMREFVGWINRSDLSSSQIGALMRVYHRGEGPISDVGEGLGVTPAAARPMVAPVGGGRPGGRDPCPPRLGAGSGIADAARPLCGVRRLLPAARRATAGGLL